MAANGKFIRPDPTLRFFATHDTLEGFRIFDWDEFSSVFVCLGGAVCIKERLVARDGEAGGSARESCSGWNGIVVNFATVGDPLLSRRSILANRVRLSRVLAVRVV
jgi:hypothetical protein